MLPVTRARSSVVAADNRGICTLPEEKEEVLEGRCSGCDEIVTEDESILGAGGCEPEVVGGVVSIDAREEEAPCCGDMPPARLEKRRALYMWVCQGNVVNWN